MRFPFLLVVLLAASGTACAQQQALSCAFAPGWQQSGALRHYVAENLFEYKDGAAEGYLSFGFVQMQGITCKSAQDTLDIDISEMSDPDAAYGIFAANLDPTQPVVRTGMVQVLHQSASLARGNQYVEIVETAADSDTDQTAIMKAFADGITARLQGRTAPPEAVDWFPPEGQASVVRMVPQSVLGLSQLKRGYVARYADGQAFVAQQDSPQAAATVLQALRARFAGATSASIGDEGFTAQAKYLDGLCIFRKGSYIAGYANLPSPAEAALLAAKIAARIP